jgi:hypothetical protein
LRSKRPRFAHIAQFRVSISAVALVLLGATAAYLWYSVFSNLKAPAEVSGAVALA